MITGTVSASKLDGALPAINGANLTGVGDGVTKSSNDPALDTNPSGGVGTLWLNTTSGEMYCCTDATANANVWANVGSGSVGVEPVYWYGNTGLIFSGMHTNSSWTDKIDQIDITTLGDATDFGGVVTQARRYIATMSTGSRVVCAGGIQGWSAFYNIIDYVTVASGADALDFGDQNAANGAATGVSDTVRGCYVGNFDSAAPGATKIWYVTLATPGNAQDFNAEVQTAMYSGGGVNDSTRGIFAGGWRAGGPGAEGTAIDYITIQTTGACNDFGDMNHGSRYCQGNTSDSTRGVLMDQGEVIPHRHEYVTIQTTGNAVDFGDRNRLGFTGACSGNGTRALEAGGWSMNPYNTLHYHIDYLTIQTLGNSQSFGELALYHGAAGGCSGD